MILVTLLLPALLGGLAFAGLLRWTNRRPSSGVVTQSVLEPMSPDLINMAHIRVAGIGGLGMVGAVVVTAIALPQIGIALSAAVGFGAAMAAGLVAYRARSSAAAAGGDDGRPPTVLALDDRSPRVSPQPPREWPGAPRAATV
jgi:hypothetical protein